MLRRHKGHSLNEIDSIISQLEAKRAAIERALAALREIEGERPAVKRRGRPPGKKARGGKRHMSAEGRAHIREGVRRRWAEKRAAEAAAQKKARARKKGGMTAAGRKRLSELMKARWASKNPPKGAGG
jgi:hypothetical protein